MNNDKRAKVMVKLPCSSTYGYLSSDHTSSPPLSLYIYNVNIHRHVHNHIEEEEEEEEEEE